MPSLASSPAAKALRIVYIAPFGLRKKATVWARILPLAQQLVAAGHRATILIPPWDSPQDAGRVEEQNGVRLEHVSLRGGIPGTVRLLVQRCDDLSPNIVHLVKPRAHAGLVHWLLHRRRQQSPLLVLDTDDWEQAWNPINRYSWPVARFMDWQEIWGIRHAAAITAASRWLVNKVRELAPQTPCLYLPNGVNPLESAPIERLMTAGDPPRVLFFSRFVETSPAWLAACWRAVLEQRPDAQLWLAGSPVQPHLAAPFQQALADLPGAAWLGYVSGEHLTALYREVSCAIFPADPVPLQAAKCSVRLATTLLHGVPVVASAVGEQTAYGAEGAANLVAAGAMPEAFAQAILETLQTPGDAAAAAQSLLARYAWRDLAHRLESFYVKFVTPDQAS